MSRLVFYPVRTFMNRCRGDVPAGCPSGNPLSSGNGDGDAAPAILLETPRNRENRRQSDTSLKRLRPMIFILPPAPEIKLKEKILETAAKGLSNRRRAGIIQLGHV